MRYKEVGITGTVERVVKSFLVIQPWSAIGAVANMASCDSQIFGLFKMYLAGETLGDDADVKQAVESCLLYNEPSLRNKMFTQR